MQHNSLLQTTNHIMCVMFLLCSAHFLISLQDIVSHWISPAFIFKAPIHMGPKFLKDQVPGIPTTPNTSPFQEGWHCCTNDTWLHKRWDLAVGEAPDQKDMKTHQQQQQLPLSDPFSFWHYIYAFYTWRKREKNEHKHIGFPWERQM